MTEKGGRRKQGKSLAKSEFRCMRWFLRLIDRTDALELASRLDRWVVGNDRAPAVVRVPRAEYIKYAQLKRIIPILPPRIQEPADL